MEDFFREVIGVDNARLMDEHRYAFPTVHLEVDFRRPLHFGDVVAVEVAVERLGRTSVDWRYRVVQRPNDLPCAEARVVTAGLDLDRFAKAPIPDWLRHCFGEQR